MDLSHVSLLMLGDHIEQAPYDVALEVAERATLVLDGKLGGATGDLVRGKWYDLFRRALEACAGTDEWTMSTWPDARFFALIEQLDARVVSLVLPAIEGWSVFMPASATNGGGSVSEEERGAQEKFIDLLFERADDDGKRSIFLMLIDNARWRNWASDDQVARLVGEWSSVIGGPLATMNAPGRLLERVPKDKLRNVLVDAVREELTYRDAYGIWPCRNAVSGVQAWILQTSRLAKGDMAAVLALEGLDAGFRLRLVRRSGEGEAPVHFPGGARKMP